MDEEHDLELQAPRDPTLEEKQTRAWQYAGYKDYCDFLACSRGFFVIRQFRTVNTRVLLALQDDIAQLSEDLDRLDKERILKKGNDEKIHNGTLREEAGKASVQKIWMLQEKLQKYCKILSCLFILTIYFADQALSDEHIAAYRAVGDDRQVGAYDLTSVKNWLIQFPNAISKPEIRYLEDREDLIYVLPNAKRPLVQRVFLWILVDVFKISFFRRTPLPAVAEMARLQNKERVDFVLSLFKIPFGLFMLIGPLWILYVVADPTGRLGVITGFIILFAALIFLLTSARAFEGLAATAG